MANLAQTQKPIDARRRASATRDFTLPGRRDTDAPRLEVNAPIVGRNRSGAQQIMELLGVATDAANAGVDKLLIAEGRERDELRAQGASAGAAGAEADPAMLKVRSYAEGFHKAAGRRSAVELSIKGQEAVTELFAKNPDATLEDVNETLDSVFGAVALDEDGKPRLLGTAAATLDFANVLSETRTKVLTEAANEVRTRQWDKDLDNRAFLLIQGGLPGVGAPGTGNIAGIELPPSVATPEAPKGTIVAPKAVPPSLVTGRMPVAGRVTDDFRKHLKRGSPGLDIAAPSGTPVELPAGGTVQVGENARSGKFVVVTHGNGVVSTYSHLSRIDVKAGQRVEPGTVLGAVGSTGNSTGPHLHYRVKVNGKDVDPASYKFDGTPGVPERPSSDPNLKPVNDGAVGTLAPPQVDFESVINDPSLATIPVAYRKEKLLQSLFIYADEQNRPDVLEGLWRSTRADGTPSFNPKEIALIRAEADRIENKAREEALRAEAKRHEDNEDQLLTEYIEGREPSTAMLQDWVRKGLISPEFAYAQVSQREQEAEQVAREARADERARIFEAEQEVDAEVASMIVERESGILNGAGYADDRQRYLRGEFGTGKKAAARFRTLQAAARRGLAIAEQDPLAKRYATQLAQEFPRPQKGDSGLLGSLNADGDGLLHDAALAAFRRHLSEGKSAPEAYALTSKEYRALKTGGRSARQARIKELQDR